LFKLAENLGFPAKTSRDGLSRDAPAKREEGGRSSVLLPKIVLPYI
jgi:hypothetical protein